MVWNSLLLLLCQTHLLLGSMSTIKTAVQTIKTWITLYREIYQMKQPDAEMEVESKEGQKSNKTGHDSPYKHIEQNAYEGRQSDEPSVPFPVASVTESPSKEQSAMHEIENLLHELHAGMLGTLNLFLHHELNYTWREASLIASQSQGHGEKHVQNICTWIHQYLASNPEQLPLHHYGKLCTSILHDENFLQLIQLHLQEKAKKGYIQAQDVVEYIENSPEMQKKLQDMGIKCKTISLQQAYHWLAAHGWRYGKEKKGMYIDGHECEDVVKY
ncbi:hypothetical protein BDQ12DRAFT_668291 [Crucibulum laeve]|uniref:Uncharacterized protein n=1 Tax=Crucibulum laeve TaxID=68775 RepID=A0A5C3LR73_9AGAR|nr:hypothetical protein BDQ12DRAFT_668291 [Crucibulum laeve]